ncbi:alpha/beta hydrolase [Microbacterium sp. DT81.1]|uniref:alpha/beta hydrolase n=1 Tax=Microbacterium sp. DT81.1 TaxID=3393413 RepID=UPI003CFA5A73
MTVFHPDLRAGRCIPKFSYGPRLARFMATRAPKPKDPGEGVTAEELVVRGPQGGPDVVLRVFRPDGLTVAAPALFWVHGGGLIGGSPQQDDATNIAFARELGITVAAVAYRFAPTHPAPAAVEDVFAGYLGLLEHAERLHIDTARVAIGGASAGGGLAAALALLIYDRGAPAPAFQLLVYPMLDDRTAARTDMDTRNVRVWTPGSNRFAWESYLGAEPGGSDVSPYAAPARRVAVSGLPPAWIGVGTLDLFYEEDIEYARRLNESGVACEVYVVPGAFHGFDAIFRKADVTQEFWAEQARALRAVLFD